MVQHYVDVASKFASYVPQHGSFHVAICFSGTKHVAATNIITNSKTKGKGHAEIRALRKFNSKFPHVSPNILVIRLSKEGELCMSKPCTYCKHALQKFIKEKRVYYSDRKGDIQTMKIREL